MTQLSNPEESQRDSKGRWAKGHAKGRPAGTQNKLMRSVRETVIEVFNKLQNDENANLLEWAKKEPTEFYKIASRLIPTELKGTVRKFVVKLKDGEDAAHEEFEDAELADE